MIADAVADATFALAIATVVAAAATVALAVITHRGIASERADAKRQIEVARDELDAAHRPLLIEVSPTGAIHPDMGARNSPGEGSGDPSFVLPQKIELKLDGRESEEVDPRQVIVRIERGIVFVSVPLRNVGRGLAVIGDGISITGPAFGNLRTSTVERPRVPVGESSRVNVTAQYVKTETPITSADRWVLEIPYTDFAGRQEALARVEIGFRGIDLTDAVWAVTAVTHGN